MERSEEEQVANTLEAKPIGGLVSDGLMNEIVPGLHHHHHHHHLHALHDHTSYVHHMGTPAGSAGSGGGNEGGRGSVSKSDLGVAADEKLTPLLGRSGTGEIENQEVRRTWTELHLFYVRSNTFAPFNSGGALLKRAFSFKFTLICWPISGRQSGIGSCGSASLRALPARALSGHSSSAATGGKSSQSRTAYASFPSFCFLYQRD